jgi:hypothetical protein
MNFTRAYVQLNNIGMWVCVFSMLQSPSTTYFQLLNLTELLKSDYAFGSDVAYQ